jgi:NADPH-dependent 2,4-dienoyl-CoA reductase/sulfur reductase-like enzyme
MNPRPANACEPTPTATAVVRSPTRKDPDSRNTHIWKNRTVRESQRSPMKNSMKKFELVIVGGGLTAARAIKSYRENGGSGQIALLTAEGVLPYHRPALSKRYLRGEVGAPFAETEAFYAKHGVEVLLGTPATALDIRARVVTTDAGDFQYGKLLLAPGSAPRRLDVTGSDRHEVYSLRTLEDSDHIRNAARTAERAVVVGGGFIGMEVAASLRQLGLEVTLIHRGSGLFDQFGSADFSDELAALYREHGVEVMLAEEAAGFAGDGRLEYVETKSGACVAADIAVVGVGVVPNVSFLARSRLVLANGIVVNQRFETGAPDVYAAGDSANFYDPLYRRRRRIEHWSNTNYQGTEVGKILAQKRGGYDTVSSFFTEIFGTTIKVFGDVSRFDALTTEGALDSGFLASYGHEGKLVGALTVGQSVELEALVRELIAERAPMDALARELVSGRSE